MAISVLFGTGHESSVPPPAHDADDWLYLFAECTSGAIATPTDWEIAPGFPVTHVGAATVLSGFRRLAVDDATPNAALSGGTNHMWGVIARVRGADLDEPQMTEAVAPGTGSSVNGYMPGVFTREANAYILGILASSLDNNAAGISSAEANADLTNVAELYDGGTATGDGGVLVAIGGDKAAAGRVGPTTCTVVNGSYACATIAFRPAPATPYVITGTATVGGSPAPDGGTIEVYRVADAVATHVLAAGDGTYSIPVPTNETDGYRVVHDNGTNFGASPKDTPATP